MSKFTSISAYAAAVLAFAQPATASSILDNGTLLLGVDDYASLGVDGGTASPLLETTVVGLRYNETGNEAISHYGGFEGWAIGDYATGSMAAGRDLNSVEAIVTPDSASILSISDNLAIRHSFVPSSVNNLYEVNVSVTNNGASDIADLRYTRKFDWNIEPGSSGAAITIGGNAPKSNATVDANHVKFEFSFGKLSSGDTVSFQLFYGAEDNSTLALSALGAVLAEVYSMGQATCDPAVGGGGCPLAANTFVFGARGLGGNSIGAEDVPLPGALMLFLSGLGGMTLLARRRRPIS